MSRPPDLKKKFKYPKGCYNPAEWKDDRMFIGREPIPKIKGNHDVFHAAKRSV